MLCSVFLVNCQSRRCNSQRCYHLAVHCDKNSLHLQQDQHCSWRWCHSYLLFPGKHGAGSQKFHRVWTRLELWETNIRQLHRGGFSGCVSACVRACLCVRAYHNEPSLHVFPSSFKPIPVGHAQENCDCVELALEGRQKWLQPWLRVEQGCEE